MSLNKKDNSHKTLSRGDIQREETKLELNKPQNSQILLERGLQNMGSKGNVSSNIQNIFSGIQKESKLTSLEKQAISDYMQLTQQHFGSDSKKIFHLSHFEKAKQKITRWISSSKINQNSNTQTAPNLSQQERISLEVFYKLHSELKNKKNDLSTQLEGVSGQATQQDDQSTNVEKIKQALTKIWWDRAKVRVLGSGTQYTEKWDANSWRKWEVNPFQNFYDDKNDYLKDFEKLNKIRHTLYRKRESLKRAISSSPSRAKAGLEAQEKSVKKDIDNNYSYRHMEAQVAKKLLSEMNQLNN